MLVVFSIIHAAKVAKKLFKSLFNFLMKKSQRNVRFAICDLTGLIRLKSNCALKYPHIFSALLFRQ